MYLSFQLNKTYTCSIEDICIVFDTFHLIFTKRKPINTRTSSRFARTKPPVEGRQGISTKINVDMRVRPCRPVPTLPGGRKTKSH